MYLQVLSAGPTLKSLKGRLAASGYVSHREETLVLTTPKDIECAMLAVTLPKRVEVQASLLSHSKGVGIENLLKRVGCLELCIQGKSAAAPRRVFVHEVLAAISHVKQHKLQKLVLKNLDLHLVEASNAQEQGPDSLFLKGLSKLHNLEELEVQSCRLDGTLADILCVTERLTELRQVTINLSDPVEDHNTMELFVKNMTSLLERPKITSLAISEFPRDEAFWKSISTSQTLTHLGLAHRHNAPDQQRYWDLLQGNSSIQQLELQVKVNTGTSLTPLMQLLKKNTTIASLWLHLQEDPTHVSQQLTTVLEHHNFTLQKAHLLCQNIYGFRVKIPSPRLNFFTKLNRQGRRQLWGIQGQPKDSEWISAMAANTYDVSSTFYWLRSNPNLF